MNVENIQRLIEKIEGAPRFRATNKQYCFAGIWFDSWLWSDAKFASDMDISIYKANQLIYGTNSGEGQVWASTSKEQAVEVLKNLIATGEVVWPKDPLYQQLFQRYVEPEEEIPF